MMLRASGSGVEMWNETPSKSARVISSKSRLPSVLCNQDDDKVMMMVEVEVEVESQQSTLPTPVPCIINVDQVTLDEECGMLHCCLKRERVNTYCARARETVSKIILLL
jgi:hypothetical protein